MVAVPREWVGQTAVVIATGPSLTAEDVDYCRGKARVLAINDAYRLAPWADALYACDPKWWTWHKGVPSFTGPKWSLQHSAWNGLSVKFPDVQLLRKTGADGLERDPTGLRSGDNSGFQAVNLAYHYGVSRIILLGFNMQLKKGRSHWFGDHPNKQQSPYPRFRQKFATLVKPLAKSGVQVVNCSRDSVLECFPKAELLDTLKASSEVAA